MKSFFPEYPINPDFSGNITLSPIHVFPCVIFLLSTIFLFLFYQSKFCPSFKIQLKFYPTMKTFSTLQTEMVFNFSYLLKHLLCIRYLWQLEMHYFVSSVLLSLCQLKHLPLFSWCVLTPQIDYYLLGYNNKVFTFLCIPHSRVL